jgi:hypothetical protein
LRTHDVSAPHIG